MNGQKKNEIDSAISQQLARLASSLQYQRTRLAPKAVNVVLNGDTLVVTLHDALTPGETALARTPEGAAQMQGFHRQLFFNSWQSMRHENKRIAGRDVCEATAEIETATGMVVHAFTTGVMVQVFLLTPRAIPSTETDRDSLESADDDRFRTAPDDGISR